MPTLVNPMDALKSFEPALKSGELRIERGRVNTDLIVHMDTPNGDWRMTYALMRGQAVGAIAIILSAEQENGLPVFQIGYAVPQHLRQRGLGRQIVEATIVEFTAGMARGGIVHFYLEAMVGQRNIASQRLASRTIGGEPRATTDSNSGEPILQYITEIGSGENRPPTS